MLKTHRFARCGTQRCLWMLLHNSLKLVPHKEKTWWDKPLTSIGVKQISKSSFINRWRENKMGIRLFYMVTLSWHQYLFWAWRFTPILRELDPTGRSLTIFHYSGMWLPRYRSRWLITYQVNLTEYYTCMRWIYLGPHLGHRGPRVMHPCCRLFAPNLG